MKKSAIPVVVLFLILNACSKRVDTTNSDAAFENTDQGWLIPFSEIVDSGGGKETIRSINNPTFLELSNPGNDYLKDDDLVVGTISGGKAKAYPHRILNFHEIVNDTGITINYCPLTGTTFGWDNTRSLFGVSGLLYQNNLILYDHQTDSNWSQLKLQCVNGTLIGEEPVLETIVETNWKTWKALYPKTLVLKGTAEQTSKINLKHRRVSASGSGKERVYAIINTQGDSKIYDFNTFSDGKALKDTFNDKTYLIVGDEHLMVSFELDADTKEVEFEYSFNNTTSFFSDNEGNTWNAFGIALSGPRVGNVMKATTAVVGFSIAIDDFYPNALRYSN